MWKRRIKNFLGILLAFGIAGGSLFLVRSRLMGEEERLLQGGSMIEIARKDLELEVQAAENKEQEERKLTEEELIQVVNSMENADEIYPHEPRPGQLDMVQVVDRGRKWMEDFFLAHLGMDAGELQGYRINCSLWAPKWDEAVTDRDMLSYWLADFSSQDMEVVLYMNAVTGQILHATVQCIFPTEHLENGDLLRLLADYAASFGIDGDYSMVKVGEEAAWNKGWKAYQTVGDAGAAAVLAAFNIAVSASASSEEYKEYFVIHIYMEMLDG